MIFNFRSTYKFNNQQSKIDNQINQYGGLRKTKDTK